MEQKHKFQQIISSPNGHKYKIVCDKHGTFFHRQFHHDQKLIGPWRIGAPPELTSNMLREVRNGIEALQLKSP